MHDEPEATLYRRRLPHWRKDGAIYFVTWRVHPNQAELAPAERTVVINALKHFDGLRYELPAAVVMNDHLHVLVFPRETYGLKSIVHSWKSFTAHSLQRAGRVGAVWQDESFDRIVRNESDFLEKANYIAENPWKRWPHIGDYEWLHFRW